MRTPASPFSRPLCLGLALLLVPVAGAQEEWERTPREPSLDSRTDEFHYIAAQDLPSGRDWIQADFSLRAANLRFAYVSTDPRAPVDLGMDARFLAVHEFIDRDGNGGLDVGDTSVQRLPLTNLAGASALRTEALTPSGYEALATYPLAAADDSGLPLASDPARTGRVEIRFAFAPEPRARSDGLLLPTQVRYDFHIVDFPYRSNESRLAIELMLSATGPPAAVVEGLATRSGPFSVSHRWTREVLVDGSARPLAVTIVQPEGEPTVSRPEASRVAYLAVPRGQDITADPVFEVERAQAAAATDDLREVLGDGRLFLIALGLSGLVIGAATIARLRRP